MPTMLKIVSLGKGHGATTLVLEGKLVGPWVDELRHSCEEALGATAQLTLDLRTVTFIDRDGIELLRKLADGRTQVTNCSPFVAEQLKARER
jgi:anti-anti-sigma regulatory factor